MVWSFQVVLVFRTSFSFLFVLIVFLIGIAENCVNISIHLFLIVIKFSILFPSMERVYFYHEYCFDSFVLLSPGFNLRSFFGFSDNWLFSVNCTFSIYLDNSRRIINWFSGLQVKSRYSSVISYNIEANIIN